MGTSISSNRVGSYSKLLLISVILQCATNSGLSAYNTPSSSSSSSFRKFPKLLHLARGKDTRTHRPNHVPFSLLWAYGYRRGEEMWPPTNVEKPVQLKDSFPLGYAPLPTSVPQKIMDHYTNSSSTTSNSTSNLVNGEERGRVKKILGRDTRFQLAKLADSVDFIPAVISIILGLMRLVHPTDGWFVLAFSAYVTFLYKWSQQPTSSDQRKGSRRGIRNTILMPALPPQGHVPFLVSKPLGRAMLDSSTYKVWIRIGWISGLVLPIYYVAWNLVLLLFRKNIRVSSTLEVLPNFLSSLRLCGSPIFLFCTQRFSESVALHLLMPLPIRILITIAYNTKRLGSIWEWCMTGTSFSTIENFGRLLAFFNMIYWSLDLFLFVIPVVAMKYLRAHFFCVEASEVTLRNEESIIGLSLLS